MVAVEARVFRNGKIVAKMRPAGPEEESSKREEATCEIWVDVFADEKEARDFLRMYRRG